MDPNRNGLFQKLFRQSQNKYRPLEGASKTDTNRLISYFSNLGVELGGWHTFSGSSGGGTKKEFRIDCAENLQIVRVQIFFCWNTQKFVETASKHPWFVELIYVKL